jgi:enoyl-CoA hydratase/carnithine racemase
MIADIAVRPSGRIGRITLTRPQALNALSYAMMQAIDEALAAWRDDPAIALVLIDAQGDRAFCSGGDIAQIYAAGRAGDFTVARNFWREEYALNARIKAYPKPYVALMNGFVMGGGVGISCHGSHRITCETTRIAMPECGIGLVPDVGGTHLLGRAPGRTGEYLGLTGHRMGAGDAIQAGFADVFIPHDRWSELTARLEDTGDIDAALPDFAASVPMPDLARHRVDIDHAFAAPDLAGLVARLETLGDWGRDTLATLGKLCPLSLACTLGLVRDARANPGIEAALAREFRVTWRCISDGDFLEGIRAAVIDKDRTPRWSHSLTGVPETSITAMREHLGADDLTLTGDTP